MSVQFDRARSPPPPPSGQSSIALAYGRLKGTAVGAGAPRDTGGTPVNIGSVDQNGGGTGGWLSQLPLKDITFPLCIIASCISLCCIGLVLILWFTWRTAAIENQIVDLAVSSGAGATANIPADLLARQAAGFKKKPPEDKHHRSKSKEKSHDSGGEGEEGEGDSDDTDSGGSGGGNDDDDQQDDDNDDGGSSGGSGSGGGNSFHTHPPREVPVKHYDADFRLSRRWNIPILYPENAGLVGTRRGKNPRMMTLACKSANGTEIMVYIGDGLEAALANPVLDISTSRDRHDKGLVLEISIKSEDLATEFEDAPCTLSYDANLHRRGHSRGLRSNDGDGVETKKDGDSA